MKKILLLLSLINLNLISKKQEKVCNIKDTDYCECLIKETSYIPNNKDLDSACKQCNADQIKKLEMVEYCDKKSGCKQAYQDLQKHKKLAKKALKPHIDRVRTNKAKVDKAQESLNLALQKLHQEAQEYKAAHPEHEVALQDFMNKCGFNKQDPTTDENKRNLKEKLEQVLKSAEHKTKDLADKTKEITTKVASETKKLAVDIKNKAENITQKTESKIKQLV